MQMLGNRFHGSVEALGPVECADMAAWIAAIPYEEWPQQPRREDGRLRPSMVTDLDWHGFGKQSGHVVGPLMDAYFENCIAYQRMLSVVMPGHNIPPHCDEQAPYWLCRVHVPLLTNFDSRFIVRGDSYSLKPGTAYLVNTEVEHAVTNDGETPRVHFMFDIRVP